MDYSVISLLFLAAMLLVQPNLSLANEPVLLFPQNTVFQFTIGMSVPIVMGKKGGIVFSSGFQFNYVLPWNLTQFEPMVIQGRSGSSSSFSPIQNNQLNLENIYTSLENLLEESGWENGRKCLLRTICELAETPLDKSGQDVVEEIIHLLLTRPSENSSVSDYSSQWSRMKLYEDAERLGTTSRNSNSSNSNSASNSSASNCALAYASCTESPLQLFTEIVFR